MPSQEGHTIGPKSADLAHKCRSFLRSIWRQSGHLRPKPPQMWSSQGARRHEKSVGCRIMCKATMADLAGALARLRRLMLRKVLRPIRALDAFHPWPNNRAMLAESGQAIWPRARPQNRQVRDEFARPLADLKFRSVDRTFARKCTLGDFECRPSGDECGRDWSPPQTSVFSPMPGPG